MKTRYERNTRLRDAAAESGLTYEALARAVRQVAAENGEVLQTGRANISHWINGVRRPTGRVPQYLAEALSRRTGRTVATREIGLHCDDAPPDAVAQPHTDNPPSALPPALESMTLLVAAVIVHDTANDRVLLLQRGPNAKFAQGKWDLPVGKNDPGEPITDTAVRELHEETGLTVKSESLRVAHLIHGARGVEAPNGFFTVVFTTRDWTGQPENREPRKHAQVRWVDVDEIPEEFVDTTASALHHYLGNGPQVSLDGWH